MKAKHEFYTVKLGRGGWSEWVHPEPGFQSKCCDCGLVHEWEFRIVPANAADTRLNPGESANAVIVQRARRMA